MSKIEETKRAYDKLSYLLDQEVLRRRGSTPNLQQFRQSLDTAFYLLGWAQFEYLVRKEAEDKIDAEARSHQLQGHAWRYLQDNLKSLSVRKRLDLLFHEDPKTRTTLERDYTVRNEAAHNYKIPREAKDLSEWLAELEKLVTKF
jgi:hypothetical protein